ncbi:hypothetical protein CEXT_393241 [Caerostris extrusa]|uniref:Dickkopf N-terminal cysteine-rich domain-containing protein n=1 Tax=Caerostris extrusa TaxID=172846 RepID=A0AAV4VQT1_CAEEX|nr:hypothetical protein CEXT_393241 [Caerostris extrusa]
MAPCLDAYYCPNSRHVKCVREENECCKDADCDIGQLCRELWQHMPPACRFPHQWQEINPVLRSHFLHGFDERCCLVLHEKMKPLTFFGLFFILISSFLLTGENVHDKI